jgi:hypothetical protein
VPVVNPGYGILAPVARPGKEHMEITSIILPSRPLVSLGQSSCVRTAAISSAVCSPAAW